VIDQVIKTRGLKITRIGPPPKGDNTHTGNIQLSAKAETAKSTVSSKQEDDSIADIMTEYGEFYMEIQFDHR